MRKISRREFLIGVGSASVLLVLNACSKQNNLPPTNTTTPVTTTTLPVVEVPVDPYLKNREILVKEDYFSGDFVTYDNGFVDPKTITPIIIDDENQLKDITVLINKYYAIKEDWIPNDLEYIETNFERSSRLRHEPAMAWKELDAAAKAFGLTFYARDGWRSKELQSTYFTSAYAKNPANASCMNAIPWRSEHQLGLALDVTDVTTTADSLRQDFEFTDHGRFLISEGWKYGWILRFTTANQAITGYYNEPWHIRYVGKDLAKILVENDLTLEEYYEKNYQ